MRVFLQFTATTPRWSADDDGVLLPMDAYAALTSRTDALRIDDIRARLSLDTVDELDANTRATLSVLEARLGEAELHLVGYEAAILVTVMEYWRIVFRAVAHDYPGATMLTDLDDPAAGLPESLMQACEAVRYLCLRDTLTVTSLPSTDAEPSRLPSGSSRRAIRESALEALDAMVGLAQRVQDSARHRTRTLVRRHSRGGARDAQALIIAHSNKKGALLTQLSGVVTSMEMTTEGILRMAPEDAVSERPLEHESDAARAAVEAYLRRRLRRVRATGPVLASLAASPWDYLLTDQENDPVVRVLLELTRRTAGKTVLATPEGAQSLVGAEMYDRAASFYDTAAPIVRCATSYGEAERLRSSLPCSDVIASGYLAQTVISPRMVARLRRAVLRLLLRADDRLVLVNIDTEPDMGAFRAGVPSMHDKLLSYQRLLLALRTDGYRVVVSCKSATGLAAVRAASRRLSEAVLAFVPWTDLLAVSTVVIQRDSSLGPEAVALGYPTIVWDDIGMPLASREWIQGNGPWVQLCTDEPGLREALARIAGGIAPEKEPHPWDLIRPDRQVADWILADRQGRTASEGTANPHQSSSIEPGD